MVAYDVDRPSGKRMFATFASVMIAIVVVLAAINVVLTRMLDVPDTSVKAASISAIEPQMTPEHESGPLATVEAEPASEPTPALVSDTETQSPASSGLTSTHPSAEPTPAVVEQPPVVSAPAPARISGIVVIDAGHQAKANMALEPIGPGASERKPKVAGGATGVVTRKPESLINLQVALRLRNELQRRGVTVVMVRTTQDVNIANSARAGLANRKRAALFVRLHCDGGSGSARGLSTLVPGPNRWTGPIVAPSAKAGRLVHKAVIKSTGAKDRGVIRRSDLAGFNWSERPTVLVEMGFMSNAAEDRRLASASYQSKLARGMADGIVQYLRER